METKPQKSAATAKQRYAASLNDPRWIARRDEMLKRDNYACRKCSVNPASNPYIRLEVHHVRYRSFVPWECPDGDMITLCDVCHARAHDEWLLKYTNQYAPKELLILPIRSGIKTLPWDYYLSEDDYEELSVFASNNCMTNEDAYAEMKERGII